MGNTTLVKVGVINGNNWQTYLTHKEHVSFENALKAYLNNKKAEKYIISYRLTSQDTGFKKAISLGQICWIEPTSDK